MGGRRDIFEFLAVEDVDSDEMDLGVTVFARLGGGHFDDFAGAAFDDDVAVLAEGRALHRVRQAGARAGGFELHIKMLVGSCHCDAAEKKIPSL